MAKHRVTMINPFPGGEQKAVDYVPAEDLDAYVADAETRWATVTYSREPDAGPGGDDGPTNLPGDLGG